VLKFYNNNNNNDDYNIINYKNIIIRLDYIYFIYIKKVNFIFLKIKMKLFFLFILKLLL
jgi:hypothetical protein